MPATSGPVTQIDPELGTTSLLVPKDHGGAGGTTVDAGIVLEELSRALYPEPWL